MLLLTEKAKGYECIHLALWSDYLRRWITLRDGGIPIPPGLQFKMDIFAVWVKR